MHLLTDIGRFLRRSGMPPTRFGREALNDPRFVSDLRNGREPGARTCARVYGYIAAQEESGRTCG